MQARPRFRPIHIDMTPFVSIALMLIVFFVWLKMVQREQYLRVWLPDYDNCYQGEYSIAKATLFLLADNRVGLLACYPNRKSAEYLETDYSAQGLRRSMAHQLTDSSSILIIKPTAESTFKNLVDVLDEIRIHGRVKYHLIDYILSGEAKLLQQYKWYKNTSNESQIIQLDVYPELTWHISGG